jgi:lipoprotein-releasing system permease protein
MRLFASRVMKRDKALPAVVSRGAFAALAVVALGVGGMAAGVSSSMWLAVTVAVAAMVAVVLLALRRLSPALAVSVIGVALSCASLTTALTVAGGFEQEVIRAISRMNGHVLLTKYGLDFFEYEGLADRFRDDPRVRGASPFGYSMIALVPESDGEARELQTGPVTAMGKGVHPTYAADMEGFAGLLERGDLSALRPGDTRHLPGLVLGRRLARKLGVQRGDRVRVVVPAELDGSTDVVGRPPRFSSFEVRDILITGSSDIDASMALMHLSAAQALFFREARVTGIEYQLLNPDDAEAVALDIEEALEPGPFRTTNFRKTNHSLLVGLRQIKATLTLLLGLLLVVAAGSVVSSLLLVVRSKQAEIATLLALGGDAKLAFWAFEWIGLSVGAMGAVGGIAVSAVISGGLRLAAFPLDPSVYPVDHMPVQLGWFELLGPPLLAVFLCGCASGPVALLATRVPVLQALRRA